MELTGGLLTKTLNAMENKKGMFTASFLVFINTFAIFAMQSSYENI
jgi:hypothetical protein